MFIFTDLDQIEGARKRAMREGLKAEVVTLGKYRVKSKRTGEYYDVFCGRNPKGEKIVSCSCETKDDIPCKHAYVAIMKHIDLMNHL